MERNINLIIMVELLLGTLFTVSCSKSNDNDIPTQPATKLVKSMIFKSEGWDDYSIYYKYDYENQIKSVTIVSKAEKDKEEETEELTVQYYNDKVILKSAILLDDPSLEIPLKTQGYAKSVYDYDLFYNEDGFLQKTNFDNDLFKKYTWKDNNMVSISAFDETFYVHFSYNPSYMNNANIDINALWIAFSENSIDLYLLRILNLCGKNSKNLIESLTEYDEGEITNKIQISHLFDKDGYVTQSTMQATTGEKGILTIEYAN